MRARLLACLFALLAGACGGVAAPGASGGTTPKTPEPSASPSPTAQISPDGRLPVVGPPEAFFFACPAGELLPRAAALGDVRDVAGRFLEAVDAREPDPRTAWELLDPSLRALFPSYETFAREMRATPYDPTYDPGARGGTEIYEIGPTDPTSYGGHLGDLLGHGRFCATETEEEVLGSYWMVQVTWPALAPCAACYQELYFLTRPDGIKYWAAFP